MAEKRSRVPLLVVVVLIGATLVVEVTGRMSGRSAIGAATGTGSGCSGIGLDELEPGEIQTGEVIAVEDDATVPKQEALVVAGEVVLRLSEESDAALSLEGDKPRSTLSDLDAELGRLALSGSLLRGAVEKRDQGHPLDRAVQFEVSEDIGDAIASLEQIPGVLYAEPVVEFHAFGVPDDTYFSYQWHLSTIGLTSAWESVDGTGVIVAVVDTGVSGGGLDGFSDLLPGYDFVDDDDDASDGNGHGTHVAGTIAQATNNGVGSAGSAPGTSILPVRVLGDDGSGTSVSVAEGIYWAVDNGAHIINLSLGSDGYSALIDEACAYAVDNGVLVVAATGNSGYGDFVSYPAALSSTLAVGATDLNGQVTYYSNQGGEVDITAPGGDNSVDSDGDGLVDGVLQETVSGGAYGYYLLAGTSMATPHVAGVAALLHSNGTTNPEDIEAALLGSADDQGDAGHDAAYGYGIVDAEAALSYVVAPSGGLEVAEIQAEAISPRRGIVSFVTSLPASSELLITAGDGGSFEQARPGERRRHHYFVRGAPGETLSISIDVTGADGSTESATSELVFPG